MVPKKGKIRKKSIRPLFQEYLDVVPIPITARDLNFNIIYANEAYASARGMKKDCIGKKCYELFKMPYCGTEKCDLVRVVKEGKPIFEELDYKREDGKVHSINACFAPLRDRGGNIIGEIIFENDVTEIRKRERELTNTVSLCNKTMEKIVQNGDLSARVDVSKLTGKHKQIGSYMNQMIDSLQINIEELRDALGSYSEVLTKVALGDLTARIDIKKLKGEHKLLGETLNSIVTILEYDTGELKRREGEISDALARYGYALEKIVDEGDLSARIDTDKLRGKHKLIGTDINLLIGSLQTKMEESKKREGETKQAKDELDLIIETSPSPMILTDERGRFMKVNRALERIVGYGRKEMLGKTSFEQPFHMDETINALKKLWKFTIEHREEAVAGMDVPWKTKDGRKVIIRGVEVPFGKGEGRLFTGMDISEIRKRESEYTNAILAFSEVLGRVITGDLSARIDLSLISGEYRPLSKDINSMISATEKNIEKLRNREEELKKAKDFSDSLFRYWPNPGTLFTPDGKRVDVNIATEKAYRGTKKDILSTKIEDVYSKKDLDRVSNAFEKCKRTGSASCEVTLLRKDGSLLPVIFNLAALKDKEENIVNIIGTVTDITELRKREISLSDAISSFGEVLSSAEKGDLSTKVDLSKIGTEYKLIGENINSLIASFNGMIETIKGASQDVTEKAERMAMASEETGSAIEAIANSMKTVTQGTMKQSEGAIKSTDDVRKLKEESNHMIKAIKGAVKLISEAGTQQSRSIASLSKSVEKVGEITEQQALAAEETESALEEQTKASEELSTIGQELLSLSEDLLSTLELLKVKPNEKKAKTK